VYPPTVRLFPQRCALRFSPMENISPEARRLVEENAPSFLAAIEHAKTVGTRKQKPARLTLTLEAFADDPFTLYACLWYAASEGVACMFVPQC
jgi:hypothetical protein